MRMSRLRSIDGLRRGLGRWSERKRIRLRMDILGKVARIPQFVVCEESGARDGAPRLYAGFDVQSNCGWRFLRQGFESKD